MEDTNMTLEEKETNTVPTQKTKRPKVFRWIALLLAVAVLAAGGGYTGTYLANQKAGRVVIQKVAETTSEETGDSESLSSTEVAQIISPSVVSITTEQMKTNQFWFGFQIASGAGSGVIISEDGYILTCAHVISGADTITVTTSEGDEYPAEVVGSYPDGDVAVIKIEATGLQAATLGDSDKIQLAEAVYAVGNPGGTLGGSITDGIISATDRTITVSVEDEDSGRGSKIITLDVLQTSAAVSPGNSGGGLFNSRGELIGIVNAKSAGESQEGLGFAIPINTAQEIATALINDGVYEDPETKDSGALEITVVELDGVHAQLYGVNKAGVYVQSVVENGASDGILKVGDHIISVGDDVVTTSSGLSKLISQHKAGESVELTIERDGKLVTVEVTLSEANKEA